MMTIFIGLSSSAVSGLQTVRLSSTGMNSISKQQQTRTRRFPEVSRSSAVKMNRRMDGCVWCRVLCLNLNHCVYSGVVALK